MASGQADKGTGGGGQAHAAGAVARAPGSGRFIGSNGLTRWQRAFARGYATNGGNAKAAAVSAGTPLEHARSAGTRALENGAVLRQIHAERRKFFSGQGASKAARTLLDLMDDDTPANVRFQAAKFVSEVAGHAPADGRTNTPADDKSLSEMTIEELEAFIAGGRAAVDQRARTIDGQAVRVDDSAPDSAPPDKSGGLFD